MSDVEETSGEIEIEIKSIYTGKIYVVKVNSNNALKTINKCVDELRNITSSMMTFIFEGRQLKNSDIIRDVGIKNGSKLELFLNMRVGPLYFHRVHSRYIRNLREVVELARKELSKDYGEHTRVLVLLHNYDKDCFKIAAFFDGLPDGKSISLNRAGGSSSQKPSSTCKLSHLRVPLAKKKHDLDILTAFEHYDIVQKLLEETRMSQSLDLLRKQMEEAALQRPRRKARFRTKPVYEKKGVIEVDRYSCDEPLYYMDKPLYSEGEFTYPVFNTYYYLKEDLTEEKLKFDNIIFRVVEEKSPPAGKKPTEFYGIEDALEPLYSVTEDQKRPWDLSFMAGTFCIFPRASEYCS